MVELITGLDGARIAANLRNVRERVARAAAVAGRDGAAVRVLAATKYVAEHELPALAEGGIELVGENRAQDLESKAASSAGLFEWHFIGQLQSRKVRAIVPHVTLIHSVASSSALAQLQSHLGSARTDLQILLEVNVSGEEGKAGIAPDALASFIERSPVPVAGLMTMPPLAANAQDSRRWFSALRELAETHGLKELSMGTSQDFEVAVEEGATIVRIGTSLYS